MNCLDVLRNSVCKRRCEVDVHSILILGQIEIERRQHCRDAGPDRRIGSVSSCKRETTTLCVSSYLEFGMDGPTWTDSSPEPKDVLGLIVRQHPFGIQESLGNKILCIGIPSFVARHGPRRQ